MLEIGKIRIVQNPRLITSIMMGGISTILFGTVVYNDLSALPETGYLEVPKGLIFRYFVAMALGGIFLGNLLVNLFGKTGVRMDISSWGWGHSYVWGWPDWQLNWSSSRPIIKWFSSYRPYCRCCWSFNFTLCLE